LSNSDVNTIVSTPDDARAAPQTKIQVIAREHAVLWSPTQILYRSVRPSDK